MIRIAVTSQRPAVKINSGRPVAVVRVPQLAFKIVERPPWFDFIVITDDVSILDSLGVSDSITISDVVDIVHGPWTDETLTMSETVDVVMNYVMSFEETITMNDGIQFGDPSYAVNDRAINTHAMG